MKYILILLTLVFQLNLISQTLVVNTYKNEENLPIMLKIKFKDSGLTTSNISLIRLGIEEALTQKKYSLINESTQQEALTEQAKQQQSDCYDDNCIIDTGKMLSAKFLILIDIIKLDKYVFKAKYINLETGVSEKVKSFIYEDNTQINDSKMLIQFSKNIVSELISGMVSYDKPKYASDSDEWYLDVYGYIPAYVKMPKQTFGFSTDYYIKNENGDNYRYMHRGLIQFRVQETTDDPFSLWFEVNFGINLYDEINNEGYVDSGAFTFELLQDLRFTIINPINRNSSYIDILSMEIKAGIIASIGTYNDIGFSSKFLLNIMWFSVGTNILYTIDNKMTLGISSGIEIGF
jgi:hypothetical protein